MTATREELSDGDSTHLRHCMVDKQLCGRGIADPQVLAAMERVPRHLFVPSSHRRSAYEDGPLYIGSGQTISQPYMVARMTELLRLDRGCRVLEVGTGSGYQAAVLGEIAGEVWTIERVPELAERSKALLGDLGYDNVHVVSGDGTVGYAAEAPYDGIMVTAAAPHMSTRLRTQLNTGGRMVLPLEAGCSQDLTLVERVVDTPDRMSDEAFDDAPSDPDRCFRETSVLRCVFVPLIGEDGYSR